MCMRSSIVNRTVRLRSSISIVDGATCDQAALTGGLVVKTCRGVACRDALLTAKVQFEPRRHTYIPKVPVAIKIVPTCVRMAVLTRMVNDIAARDDLGSSRKSWSFRRQLFDFLTSLAHA